MAVAFCLAVLSFSTTAAALSLVELSHLPLPPAASSFPTTVATCSLAVLSLLPLSQSELSFPPLLQEALSFPTTAAAFSLAVLSLLPLSQAAAAFCLAALTGMLQGLDAHAGHRGQVLEHAVPVQLPPCVFLVIPLESARYSFSIREI